MSKITPSPSVPRPPSPSTSPTAPASTAGDSGKASESKADASKALSEPELQSRTRLGVSPQSSAEFAASQPDNENPFSTHHVKTTPRAGLVDAGADLPTVGNPYSLDRLTHPDAAVRNSAFDAAGKAAAEGKPDALQALTGVINKEGGVDKLDYRQRGELRGKAADALAGAKDHLGAEQYQALAKSLGDMDIRKQAQSVMTDAAKAGKPEALDALRQEAQSRYGSGHEATDALANAGEHLNAQDYQLLAKQGLGRDYSQAHKTLAAGVQDSNPHALAAVRDTLAKTQGDYNLAHQQGDAAKLLTANPEQIRKEDLPNLERLANKPDGMFDARNGFEAIAAAAARKPPVEGASDSFVRTMKAAEQAADGERGKRHHLNMRDVSQRMAPKAFAAAEGDPAARQALAPYALDAARDSKTGNAAVDTLAPAAAQGDKDALAALAKASGRSFIMPRETRDRAHDALMDSAANGRAGEVSDALKGEFERAGKDDDGRVLEGLGKAASHLPADDPRMDGVRSTLREGLGNSTDRDKSGHSSAAKGMEAIADRLDSKDIDALQTDLNEHSGSALAAAAKHLPDDQRAELHKDLRERVGSNLYRDRGAMTALAGDAEAASPEDVEVMSRQAKMSGGFDSNRQQAREALTGVLGKAQDPAAQSAAANALLDLPANQLDATTRGELTDHAVASNDPALKQKVLDKLPSSPITDKHLQNVSKTYGRLVTDKIKGAEEGSDWNKLGQLMTAKEMAKDPKYADNVDTAKIDQKINDLCNGPLKDDLEGVRQQAIRQATPYQLGNQQADYLKSDDFQHRLSLQSPDQQRQSIQTELGKLQGVAPGQVQDVADHLAGRAAQENAVGNLQSLKNDPEGQENALGKAIQTATGITGTSGGVTKKLASAINALDPKTPSNKVAKALSESLSEAQKAARRAGDVNEAAECGKALRLLKDIDANGKLSSVLTGASLLGLAAGGMPKSGEEWAKASATVLNSVGNASDIGKLFRVNKATQLGKALKFMDWAGPAGDLLGAGVDGYNAYKDFKQGDNFGGAMKTVGAASGVAGAAAGVAILAGASGPAAPVVLLGATVVGLAAWGLDAWLGKSDEQSFLENVGVWKDD